MGVQVDVSGLEKFRDRLLALDGRQREEFMESAVKGLAARLLADVKNATPVGQYPAGSGKTGGTLRRRWKAGGAVRKGGTVSVEVKNPVEYAPYVEYGHRTRGGKGWIPGRFMLTSSERSLSRDMPKIMEAKLRKFIGGLANG